MLKVSTEKVTNMYKDRKFQREVLRVKWNVVSKKCGNRQKMFSMGSSVNIKQQEISACDNRSTENTQIETQRKKEKSEKKSEESICGIVSNCLR